MELDEAAPADLAAVAALMNCAYRGEAGWATEFGMVAGERTRADLLAADLRAAPDARLLVTRDPAGTIGGCVWLEPLGERRWYLGSLTVAPERQARGMGARLLAAAEERVRGAGGRIVRMTVVHPRETLIAWYERRGYRRTGATEPWPYGDDRFGVPLRDDLRFVVLEKALG